MTLAVFIDPSQLSYEVAVAESMQKRPRTLLVFPGFSELLTSSVRRPAVVNEYPIEMGKEIGPDHAPDPS